MDKRFVGLTACARSLIGAALLMLIWAPAAQADDLSDAVLAELNFARTQPIEYARELRQAARRDDLDEDGSSFAPADPRALREAIDFLERQQPLQPLRSDRRLAASAKAHVEAQGPSGEVGHDEAGGGFDSRLHRYGVWAGLSGENIAYGYRTPREIVRQLIVDSGVESRGHRKNIFDTAYQYAGVGCGRHRIYGYMCVIDFAGILVRR